MKFQKDKLTINFLRQLDEAYEKGQPLVTDYEYDLLKEKIRKLYPDDPYWDEIGYGKFDQDIFHRVPMISLDKINVENFDDIINWINNKMEKLNTKYIELCFQPKIDGLSCSIMYENKRLKYAATRGDGIKGKDITANIVYVKGVEKQIPFEGLIEIRGEIYKNKYDFEEKWSKLDFMNPRNFAAGSIRQKDPLITKERELDFIAYEVIFHDNKDRNNRNYLDKLVLLNKMNFKTPNGYVLRFENNEENIKLIKDVINTIKNETYNFEIDGIVMKINNYKYCEQLGYANDGKIPRFNIAIKFISKEVTSLVTKIEFNVGKTGRITPLVYIEPVELLGSKISKVTMHNMSMFNKEDKLGIGSKVIIKKAGDIIPIISRVITNGEKVQSPDKCPDCNSQLKWEGQYLVCINDKCPSKILNNMYNFISVHKVKGIAKKSLEKIIKEFNISEEYELFNLKLDELKKLFGNKRGENIYRKIEEIIKNMNLSTILKGLSIGNFGKLVDRVIDNLNGKNIFNITEEDLIKIEGISKKKAKLFLDDLKKNEEKIRKLVDIKVDFFKNNGTNSKN